MNKYDRISFLIWVNPRGRESSKMKLYTVALACYKRKVFVLADQQSSNQNVGSDMGRDIRSVNHASKGRSNGVVWNPSC